MKKTLKARNIFICAIIVIAIAGAAWGGVYFTQRGENGLTPIYSNSNGYVAYQVSPIENEDQTQDITKVPQPGNEEPEQYSEQESYIWAMPENVHYPRWVMDDIIQVSAGDFHTMAIKADGSLWGWGGNFNGTLGDGTTTDRDSPVWIMDDIIAVSAGWKHTVAITSDGGLWTWGDNSHGQLGDGTTENRYSPVRVMNDVVAITTSTAPDPGPFIGHTMAIRSDGSLWAWGANESGQLGDGTTEDRHSPVQVMEGVSDVAASSWSTTVLGDDGSLWIFSRNWFYGDENNSDIQHQVRHKIIDGVYGISDCGKMAIMDDGRLLRVGLFWDFEDGNLTWRTYNYVVMDNIDNVAHASSGALGTTMAIRTDGSLWGWGNNFHGQLGVGAPTDFDFDSDKNLIPVFVMDDAAAVSVGTRHVMAIRADGSLWGWGWNVSGQLGANEDSDYAENLSWRLAYAQLLRDYLVQDTDLEDTFWDGGES